MLGFHAKEQGRWDVHLISQPQVALFIWTIILCSPCHMMASQLTANSAQDLGLILQKKKKKSLGNIRENILVLPSMNVGWAK